MSNLDRLPYGGQWLSAARWWLQRNILRGDTLPWDSDEMVSVPFRMLEGLALTVATAATKDVLQSDALTNETIQDYAKTIGLGGPVADFNVHTLIKCHKELRDIQEHMQDRFVEAYDHGIEAGKKFGLESNYVSVDQLRKMTMQEISDLITNQDF